MSNGMKNIIFLFVALCGITFFRFSFIGENGYKLLELAGIGLIVLFVVLQLVYERNELFPFHFKYEIILILFGVLLSMFMAAYAHGQNLKTTAIAQRSMYYYFFYVFLHIIRLRKEHVEKMILYMAIGYSFLFLLQFALFPTMLFDARVDMERGTIRIFLPGLSFLLLAFFYSLNKVIYDQNYNFVIPPVLFLIIVVLLGTRQILFALLLVSAVNVILSGTLNSKFVIGVIAMLAVVPMYLLFKDIITELIQLSQTQAEGIGEDVRVRAAHFFLTDFYPNRMAYITGNGAHSLNSSYGEFVESLKVTKGFYQSDIGIIGDYTRFGIFFVIGVMWLLFRSLFINAGKDLRYIRFYFLYILLTIPVSGQEFTSPSSLIVHLTALYLLDVGHYSQKFKMLNRS